MSVSGLKDVLAKRFGGRNQLTNVQAAIRALSSLKPGASVVFDKKAQAAAAAAAKAAAEAPAVEAAAAPKTDKKVVADKKPAAKKEGTKKPADTAAAE
jgi:hypothetical protein